MAGLGGGDGGRRKGRCGGGVGKTRTREDRRQTTDDVQSVGQSVGQGMEGVWMALSGGGWPAVVCDSLRFALAVLGHLTEPQAASVHGVVRRSLIDEADDDHRGEMGADGMLNCEVQLEGLPLSTSQGFHLYLEST